MPFDRGRKTFRYLHSIIFALRTAFADGRRFVHDPCFEDTPIKGLLSKDYLSSRSELFNIDSVDVPIEHGYPPEEAKCDTAYFSVTDSEGGGCSFIKYSLPSLLLTQWVLG